MKKRIASLSLFAFLALGSISTSVVLANKEETFTPSFATYQNHDADTYYQGVSDNLTGNDLLGKLQGLNNSKRRSTVGYGPMLDALQYKYTDYDPDSVQYDDNNQPYSEKIVGFYSGSKTYNAHGMNREHVWPDSRGGNQVEKDIHMPRPTIIAENGSRGNSFYVEGKCSSSGGWDPAMESFGDATYRGDSARIIFYCAIASNRLTLVDKDNDSSGNMTMGKLSDMIKWHLTYPVLEREMNRNEGAEYLQGNRNPFIDHPEYVCRIWGNTNDATRALCANDPYINSSPTEITLNKTTVSLKLGETAQLSVKSVVPANASKSVTWTSNNPSVISVDDKGLVKTNAVGEATITATSTKDTTIKATCKVTSYIPENVNLEEIRVIPNKLVLSKGDSATLDVEYLPEEAYPVPTNSFKSNNTNVASVDEYGSVTGVDAGETTIVVTSTQGSISVSKSVNVTVVENTEDQYTLVTNKDQLKENDKVVVAMSIESIGVSGASDKTATVSDEKDEWVKYVVKNYSGNGFKLYDSTKNQYIASPTSNEFKYGETGGTCDVNEDGVLKCNSRYLCKNGNVYRFYTSIQSAYSPFHVFKVTSQVPAPTEKKLESIAVTGQTTSYKLNDDFAFDGTCVAYFDDDSSKAVIPTSVSAPDMTTVGEKQITVTYTEGGITKSATYTITVSNEIIPPSTKTLVSIYVSHMPNKTEYVLNEAFVREGLEIKASYDDGSESLVSDYSLILPPGFGLTEGEVTINVTYSENDIEKATSFKVTIKKESSVPHTMCGGEIVSTSIILSTLTLIGIVLLVYKKLKEA